MGVQNWEMRGLGDRNLGRVWSLSLRGLGKSELWKFEGLGSEGREPGAES